MYLISENQVQIIIYVVLLYSNIYSRNKEKMSPRNKNGTDNLNGHHQPTTSI